MGSRSTTGPSTDSRWRPWKRWPRIEASARRGAAITTATSDPTPSRTRGCRSPREWGDACGPPWLGERRPSGPGGRRCLGGSGRGIFDDQLLEERGPQMDRRLLAPETEVEHLDEHREAHREEDADLRDGQVP